MLIFISDDDEDVNLHSEIRLNKLARLGARASARSKLVMFVVRDIPGTRVSMAGG